MFVVWVLAVSPAKSNSIVKIVYDIIVADQEEARDRACYIYINLPLR